MILLVFFFHVEEFSPWKFMKFTPPQAEKWAFRMEILTFLLDVKLVFPDIVQVIGIKDCFRITGAKLVDLTIHTKFSRMLNNIICYFCL